MKIKTQRGLVQFGLFVLILILTVIYPYLSQICLDCAAWFKSLIQSQLQSAPRPPYLKHWFIASLLINVASISFTLRLIWKDRLPLTKDLPVIVLLSCLLLLSILAILVADFGADWLSTGVTMGMYIGYIACDIIGRKVSSATEKTYALPLFCVDLPALAVMFFFLCYNFWSHPSAEFMTGASAAILIVTNVVYTSVQMFLIEE